MNKPILYFISGLGSDHRAYLFLNFDDYECKYIEWVEHNESDTLGDYAKKLLPQFDTSKPIVIIGTSLGGMLATEINKLIDVKHTFIISSVKTKSEQPGYFNFFRIFPMYNFLPDSMLADPNFWLKLLFPAGMKEEWKSLFADMFSKWSPSFLRWAMKAALWWDNTHKIKHYTHIHGDQDFVFPCIHLKDYIQIKNGTHIMVLTKAREIKQLIDLKLQEIYES